LVLSSFLTFIIAISSHCYAKSPTDSPIQDKQYSSTVILNTDKSDIDTAKHIAKLKSQVLALNPSLSFARKTLNKVTKRPIYKDFIPWNKSIITVLSQNNKTNHFNLCKSIEVDLSTFCLESFLNKYRKHDLSSFFKDDTAFFVSTLRSKSLSKFLKTARSKKLITKYFIEQFKGDPKLINRMIVKNLDHNRELTQIIQETNLFESKYVFKKVIRSKVTEIYEKLEKDENFDTELKALLTYTKDIHKKINTQIIFKSLFVLGKTFNQKKKYTSARLMFSSLMEMELGNRSALYFESIWSYILEEDFDQAYKVFIKKEKVLSELTSYEDNRIDFWLAHIFIKNGKEDKAHSIYKNIIYTSPLSYYSIMSAKKLSKNEDTNFTKTYLSNLQNKELKTIPVITYHENEKDKLVRIKIWDLVGAKRLLRAEKNAYLRGGFTNPYLKVSKLFYDDGNYLEGFKAIYRGINLNIETLNPLSLTYLYPTQYLSRLQKVKSDFDPIIALSLIRQESAFNKNARSHVGARGLMQIMPNTGKRLHRKLRTHQLYNPKLNIKIGTKYLKKLLKRYDDNLVYTLAAYNAGESRVKRWKKELFHDDSILENIEKIPFLETRKYVKLIFRNIFFYKLLGEDKKASRALASNDQNYLYDVYLGF
jgi:soluble lytic murein transglycosylase